MPRAPKTICRKPGCHRTCHGPYCTEHATAKPAPPAWRTSRTSAHARGYGANWRRLRLVVLARDPVCVLCSCRAATSVDHILAKAHGGTDDMDNLRGLCRSCHAAKSSREGARGLRTDRLPRR